MNPHTEEAGSLLDALAETPQAVGLPASAVAAALLAVAYELRTANLIQWWTDGPGSGQGTTDLIARRLG